MTDAVIAADSLKCVSSFQISNLLFRWHCGSAILMGDLENANQNSEQDGLSTNFYFEFDIVKDSGGLQPQRRHNCQTREVEKSPCATDSEDQRDNTTRKES